ncbi:hypothetical protein NLJ89_g2196 [Agrocybe chaxingu]|uniref:F-box domain-containing protein n=1 Tax=Agrocybe chaxingu TaxID=84603 RepID=A0A9W8K7B9_9AGAR|nr:hypothetical protein NLJ89_g2196 [Agrocybe chaxingu]
MYSDGMDPESTIVVNDAPPSVEISPISTLPPELLSSIFILARPQSRFPPVLPFEVVISHVSRYWREVALSTPQLWSKIYIYSSASTKWIRPYLRRSGCYIPLDVYIDVYRADRPRLPGENSSRRSNQLKAATIPLLLHFDRIRRVSILCHHESTALALLSGFVNPMPCLESFKVKYDYISATADQRSHFSLFGGSSPRLAFLETDMPNILPASMMLDKLTTLYLHNLSESVGFDFRSFTRILTSPPNLRNLSLNGTINSHTWPVHHVSPKFTMKNLQALRLLDDGPTAMRMPVAVFDSPQFNGRPKFPDLRYLTIQTDNLFLSERFSKIFPTITHLHLPYPDFHRHVLHLENALVGRWKGVHTIVLTMYRERNEQRLVATLLALLPTRRNSGHPVKSLLVDQDHLKMLRVPPRLSSQVDLQLVSPENYQEVWWNLNEQHSKGED